MSRLRVVPLREFEQRHLHDARCRAGEQGPPSKSPRALHAVPLSERALARAGEVVTSIAFAGVMRVLEDWKRRNVKQSSTYSRLVSTKSSLRCRAREDTHPQMICTERHKLIIFGPKNKRNRWT